MSHHLYLPIIYLIPTLDNVSDEIEFMQYLFSLDSNERTYLNQPLSMFIDFCSMQYERCDHSANPVIDFYRWNIPYFRECLKNTSSLVNTSGIKPELVSNYFSVNSLTRHILMYL
jgi:hypothetical protein